MVRLVSFHFYFYFYRLYSKQLGFFSKTWGLRSILDGYSFNCFCLEFYRGGYEVFRYFFLVFPNRSGLFVPSNNLGGIQSCLHVVRSSGRSFGGTPEESFLVTWSETLFYGAFMTKGIQTFWRDCSYPSRDVPGSLQLAFFFSCLVTVKVLTGWLYSLWQDFWSSRLS